MKPADSAILMMLGSGWTDIPKPVKTQLKRLMDATFIEVRTVTIHPWYSPAAEGQWMIAHGGWQAVNADPTLRGARRERHAVTVVVQARMTPTGEDALAALGILSRY